MSFPLPLLHSVFLAQGVGLLSASVMEFEGYGGLSVVRSLTNLAEVNRMLHETLMNERVLESKLDALYKGKNEKEDAFIALHKTAGEVEFADAPPSCSTTRETNI